MKAPSADTFSKVVLPVATLLLSVAVFLGTRAAATAESQSKAKAQCRDSTVALLAETEAYVLMSPDASTGAAGENNGAAAPLVARASRVNDQLVARAQKIDVEAKFLDQNCRDAGLPIPLNVQRSLCTAANLVPDADIKSGLILTADSIADRNDRSDLVGCDVSPPNGQLGGLAQGVAPNPNAENAVGSAPTPRDAPPLRLFVQYPQSAGRGAADPLREAILAKGLAGQKIIVPAAEAVSMPVTASTLRCLKAVDCARAAPLVTALNAMLERPTVKLLDLSSRYNSRSDVRTGDLELWLTAADVRLRSRS
jgi:hypothetical protein